MPRETRSGAGDAPGFATILAQHKGVILAWVVVLGVIGLALNAFTPPIYRASVRLEIRKPPERSPLTGEAVGSSSFQSENVAMFTAAELITNRTLLGHLVDEMGGRGWIGGGPEPDPERRAFLERLPGGHASPFVAPRSSDPVERSARIDWLQGIIRVEPVRDTRLVDIKVEHPVPEAAQAIGDRLARLFVDYQNDRTADADTSGLTSLKSQMAQVKGHIETSEDALYASRRVSYASLQARQRQLTEAIGNLNDAAIRARGDRVALDARLSRLESFLPDSGADLTQLPVESGTLDALRRDLVACELRLATARGIYGEKHPRLLAAESECVSLRASVRDELRRTLAGMRSEQSALRAREDELQASLTHSEGELAVVQEQSQRYATVENDLKINGDLYGMLMTKVQEGRIAGQMKTPAVEIVDPATVDPQPVRPRKLLNLAVCLIVGGMTGLSFALLRHGAHRTIQAPEELEHEFELPVLGVIPRKASSSTP